MRSQIPQTGEQDNVINLSTVPSYHESGASLTNKPLPVNNIKAKEHLLTIPTQEGDGQIWGQVIKINGQRDAPYRHL